MSRLVKHALKLSLMKSVSNSFRQVIAIRPQMMSRSLSHMCGQSPLFGGNSNGFNQVCWCGCGSTRQVHSRGGQLMNKAALTEASVLTPGEKELAEFLTEEIASEKKLQKSASIPKEVDGFKVVLDGSEVSLIKTTGNEVVEVNFNVNHSVDTESEPEIDPSMEKPELGELKSRPSFEIEIKRGGKTLGFTCSMVSPTTPTQEEESGYNDLFAIDEVVMYEGEWKESNYAVSGEVLDGTLYDLLMNLLEDKGITNEFVAKLIGFSTTLEHSSYIKMLENVQKFVSVK